MEVKPFSDLSEEERTQLLQFLSGWQETLRRVLSVWFDGPPPIG